MYRTIFHRGENGNWHRTIKIDTFVRDYQEVRRVKRETRNGAGERDVWGIKWREIEREIRD